jgi:hypothetical protein
MLQKGAVPAASSSPAPAPASSSALTAHASSHAFVSALLVPGVPAQARLWLWLTLNSPLQGPLLPLDSSLDWPPASPPSSSG